MQDEPESHDTLNTREFFFQPCHSTNVHIKTKDNGHIFVHSLILEIRSFVFRELEYKSNEKTVIDFDFSYEATLVFFNFMYAIDIGEIQLNPAYVVEVWKICFKYDMKPYFEILTECVKDFMTQSDDDEFCWINIGNLASQYKQIDLIDFIFEKHVACNLFLSEGVSMLKLNSDFKDHLLSRLLTQQPNMLKKELYEVKDENGDWCVAEIISKDSNVWRFHIQGHAPKRCCNYDPMPNVGYIANMGTRNIKKRITTDFGVIIKLE
jgi:hypothetical protein